MAEKAGEQEEIVSPSAVYVDEIGTDETLFPLQNWSLRTA